LFNILDIHDLELIPWNIILLFAGAMSIGFCLWQTGAAEWLAINWLGFFTNAHWFVFVMGIAFFILVMTNFIMNVAAIAISLPVALVVAPYLGVASEVILFAALTTAGMPFLLLVGAAPNAIAYNSRQFTSGEFFAAGIPCQHFAAGGAGPDHIAGLAADGHAGCFKVKRQTHDDIDDQVCRPSQRRVPAGSAWIHSGDRFDIAGRHDLEILERHIRFDGDLPCGGRVNEYGKIQIG
jgi:hypothetical protein